MSTRYPGYVQPSPGYTPVSPDYLAPRMQPKRLRGEFEMFPASPMQTQRLRGEVEVTARVVFGEAPHSPSEMYAYRAPLPVQPVQPEPVLHFLQVASQQPSAGLELVLNGTKQREVFPYVLIIF